MKIFDILSNLGYLIVEWNWVPSWIADYGAILSCI